MTSTRKDRILQLLKGIETGDPLAAAVVSPVQYIQHNPQTHEGREGLAALFERLSKTSPRVRIVRAFEDGHYVFAHTEYDFETRRIGFEVFRFEGDFIVEHWDNIQPRQGPNPSGHSMVDGPTEATDLDRTETNRETVLCFAQDILIAGRLEELDRHIDAEGFTQHLPTVGDGRDALHTLLTSPGSGSASRRYDRVHRTLAEGSFVLCVCEGAQNGVHSAFYDLFRVAEGRLFEQWGTVEAIPPRSEWKNDNGKF